ncbi:type-2 ice-structuring protein-like [Mastacembelus armatus]|uniref:Type-2 ice-structuring protein-like n=1 Tax=Mastacembelus armatus TaxID=205130 RepID=A0A7N8X5D2_9TELE|nr:type-2 ice-structuring protein-like [Mastacembelus armatus]
MKMLTVSLFVCATMALARAGVMLQVQEETEESNLEAFTAIPPLTQTMPGYFNGWVPTCPNGWTMYSTRCVRYVPEMMTWAEAQTNCAHMSGHLASVYDAEQANEIRKVMMNAGQQHKQVWVGGSNTPEDHTWYWSDYLNVNKFHHWCHGEDVKRKHHCLHLTFEENDAGCLDGMVCGVHFPSVCAIIIM